MQRCSLALYKTVDGARDPGDGDFLCHTFPSSTFFVVDKVGSEAKVGNILCHVYKILTPNNVGWTLIDRNIDAEIDRWGHWTTDAGQSIEELVIPQ